MSEPNPTNIDQSFKKEVRKLKLQTFLGWLTVIPLGWAINFIFRFKMKYKIRNLKEIRKTYQQLTDTNQPVMICPNHLTMADSNIQIWAFGKMPWYFLHYKRLSWNVPAVENFKSTWTRSIITYLGKCIPVDREGTKEHHDMVLNKTIYLMKQGHVFTYFPEGGRSRKARIDMDNIRYGVGKLLADIPNAKVICVYMRGDAQEGHSEVPAKGDTLTIKLKEVNPTSKSSGLRAHRDISQQIMQSLKEMEDEYFSEKNSNKTGNR